MAPTRMVATPSRLARWSRRYDRCDAVQAIVPAAIRSDRHPIQLLRAVFAARRAYGHAGRHCAGGAAAGTRAQPAHLGLDWRYLSAAPRDPEWRMPWSGAGGARARSQRQLRL